MTEMNKNFLSRIRQNFVDKNIAQHDADILISFVSLNSCDVDAYCLLVEIAWYHRELFAKPWSEYYDLAILKSSSCQNSQEFAELHYLAGTLFSHDQLTEKVNLAVKLAFELAPNNWRNVDAYVHRTRPFLSENIAIPLIEELGQLASKSSIAHYRQGFLYERYAKEFSNSKYKQKALSAYQRSIELGLQNEVNTNIIEDAKRAFIRLNNIS